MNIVFLLYHPSAFTNWINKLAPFLDNANIFILHISKLHGVQPKIKDGYTPIDISYYSYAKLEKTLQDINPDLFVFLSFRSLLEYAVNRLCTKLNIQKIYLEHGLFSTDTLRFRKNKLKKEILQTTKRQFAYWFLLSGLVMHSKHSLLELKLANKVYIKNDFSVFSCDHYFLFSKRSYECYRTIFDLNERNSTYIGYPIFNSEAEKRCVDAQEYNKGVLYVHQPLISDGIAKISFNEEKIYLQTLAQNVKEKYGDFTILLHPRANLREYEERYNDTSIKIVQLPNNYRCFANKSLIIGHYSTALLYGLYFDKPTIVVDYPTVKVTSIFKELFVYCKDVKSLAMLNDSVDVLRKDYIVGEHNTFEYIAKTLLSE